MWTQYDQGKDIGEQGSEGGIIIEDETYKDSCRITLEKDGAIAPYSITCGVYGLMVHTVYVGSLKEGKRKFNAMKESFQHLIDNPDIDPIKWCDKFVHAFQ